MTIECIREMTRLAHGRPNPDVASYILSQTPEHQERLAMAWDFAAHPSHSTEAFREAPPVPFGAALPTSSQETSYLPNTLAQYKAARGRFKTLAFLNWTEEAPQAEITATRRILTSFIASHPNVPIGFFEGALPQPQTIGHVRRLATDALLPLMAKNGLIAAHDADMQYMSPNLPADMCSAYINACIKSETPCGVMPTVIHQRVPHLRNLNMLIRWMDEPDVQLLTGKSLETGIAVNIEHYMGANGYDIHDKTTEIVSLMKRIAENEWVDLPARAVSLMVTSERRLVEKFTHQVAWNKIWKPGTFLARDACRTGRWANVTTDVSERFANRQLRGMGKLILTDTLHTLIADAGLSKREAGYEAFKQLEKIRAYVGGPEDMFTR